MDDAMYPKELLTWVAITGYRPLGWRGAGATARARGRLPEHAREVVPGDVNVSWAAGVRPAARPVSSNLVVNLNGADGKSAR
jgi:hypothetical protein